MVYLKYWGNSTLLGIPSSQNAAHVLLFHLLLQTKFKWREMDNIKPCITLWLCLTCWNLCLTGQAHLARSHMCVNYSKKNSKVTIVKTSPTNRKWLSSCDKMFIRKCCYSIQNISCLWHFLWEKKACLWCQK